MVRSVNTKILSIALIGAVIACAPSVREEYGIDGVDAGDGDGYDGPTARVRGTVWAPGNAPGMVPTGQEIPIFNAVITLTANKLPPIPRETYCEKCIDPQGKHTSSDHAGEFSLANIRPGTYWLTIQKGQFRLEQQVVMSEFQELELMPMQTTLPSAHNPDLGQWIPKIAIAVGDYDAIEDILGKMGLGGVDPQGRFVGARSAGVFDVYDNGGAGFDGLSLGSLSSLVGSLESMLQFHMIFIPCAGTHNTTALLSQQNLKNIRDYVAAGGKLYVTDWSGEWHDNVFPEQVTLSDSGTDTPAAAYNKDTDTWNTSMFGDADGSSYTSNNAEVVDDDLRTWLDGQEGPTADSPTPSVFNASLFTAEGNWNAIDALTSVPVGTSAEGFTLYDEPKAYVVGGRFQELPKKPLTVTYEPAGCGRVLYSTYHTTDNTHVGLVPQERILLYLLMEIGVCTTGGVIE